MVSERVELAPKDQEQPDDDNYKWNRNSHRTNTSVDKKNSDSKTINL